MGPLCTITYPAMTISLISLQHHDLCTREDLKREESLRSQPSLGGGGQEPPNQLSFAKWQELEEVPISSFVEKLKVRL